MQALSCHVPANFPAPFLQAQEGWQPAAFSSSRSAPGQRQQQSVEQFMDADELEEMQKKGLSLNVGSAPQYLHLIQCLGAVNLIICRLLCYPMLHSTTAVIRSKHSLQKAAL
jgi:hypothetical protein